MFGVDCVIICLYLDNTSIFEININVCNAIKLSNFEVKNLCETTVMHLSIIENILIYVNHTLNAITEIWQFNGDLVRTPYDASMSIKENKWDSISQSEYARDYRKYYVFDKL